ncbi:uncharacterized protein VTP21DRAFT_10238 [Calcarisporiella thermophila]|uniref:uncharacterized protein n=1 Tax=Calcarisporiella thermophila TaxID=911321 RepID=UPI00374379CC
MLLNVSADTMWRAALALAAIVAVAGARALLGFLVPPRQLRQVPSVPALPFLWALLRMDPFEKTSRRFIMPAVKGKGAASVRGFFEISCWKDRANRRGGQWPQVWMAGRWGLFLSSPAYVKFFMTHTDAIPKVSTESQGKFILDFFGAENVASSNGEEWRRHRKVLNPAFRHTIPTQPFGDCTLELFEHIDSAISRNDAVDIPLLMRRLTLDALGKALFNFNFNALRDPDNEYCRMYNGTFDGLINPFRILFPKADPLISLFERNVTKSLRGLNKLVYNIIDTRTKEIKAGLFDNAEERDKDMLTLMIEASNADNESNWTTEDIKNNLMVFFLAGHDTTQASLSVAIYFLAIFPEIQELARQEVDRILGDADRMQIPSVEQCRNMKYIECIVKETLRIHPPAPNIGPRVVKEAIDMDGLMLPKGTYLFADFYTMQNSPEYWKNPDKFWPERFLPENNPPRDAWMPFGGGSRICLGMQFSLTEQRVVLSMLLRNYTWKLPANSPHEKELQVQGLFGVLRLQDVLIQFEKRN